MNHNYYFLSSCNKQELKVYRMSHYRRDLYALLTFPNLLLMSTIMSLSLKENMYHCTIIDEIKFIVRIKIHFTDNNFYRKLFFTMETKLIFQEYSFAVHFYSRAFIQYVT